MDSSAVPAPAPDAAAARRQTTEMESRYLAANDSGEQAAPAVGGRRANRCHGILPPHDYGTAPSGLAKRELPKKLYSNAFDIAHCVTSLGFTLQLSNVSLVHVSVLNYLRTQPFTKAAAAVDAVAVVAASNRSRCPDRLARLSALRELLCTLLGPWASPHCAGSMAETR